MEPDKEALVEFANAWRNALNKCLNRDDPRIDAWIETEIRSGSRIPQFYNNPPGFYLVKEFIPATLRIRLEQGQYTQLWLSIFEVLESCGHWNNFADDEECHSMRRRIDSVLHAAGLIPDSNK